MPLPQWRFDSSISCFFVCLSDFAFIASSIVDVLLWSLFLPHPIFSHHVCWSEFCHECLILPSVFQSITNFAMCIFSCCHFHFVLIFSLTRLIFFPLGQFLQFAEPLPTTKVSLFPNFKKKKKAYTRGHSIRVKIPCVINRDQWPRIIKKLTQGHR